MRGADGQIQRERLIGCEGKRSGNPLIAGLIVMPTQRDGDFFDAARFFSCWPNDRRDSRLVVALLSTMFKNLLIDRNIFFAIGIGEIKSHNPSRICQREKQNAEDLVGLR